MSEQSIIPLWNPIRVASEIAAGPIFQHLNSAAQHELSALSDMEAKVVCALTDPKPLDIVMPVLNAVLAAQYFEIFQALNLPPNMRVYEPCVGASNPVIIAAEAHSSGAANYVTINLNKNLCEQLKPKISHLTMSIQIIEGNAQQALALLAPGSFDVACFHHAVNDILQTAVSEPRGLDTTQIDWFPTERQMIEWLAEDARNGKMDQCGKPELLQIVGDAIRLVRPGGFLIFDHFNWQKFIGVDWFPWDLFYNFIPTTRKWISENNAPVSEIRLDGADPQWWMILQRNA